MLPFNGYIKMSLDFSDGTFGRVFNGSARCRDMVHNLIHNLVLKAINGEMFSNTKVMDEVINLFSDTVPPCILIGVASREPSFM